VCLSPLHAPSDLLEELHANPRAVSIRTSSAHWSPAGRADRAAHIAEFERSLECELCKKERQESCPHPAPTATILYDSFLECTVPACATCGFEFTKTTLAR